MRASPSALGSSDQALEALGILEERLRRYPVERYPMQHATAQFHLGMTLTQLGRLPEAAAALERAAYLFEDRLVAEHARALNALGAVYRQQQRQPAAADVFRRAAAEFGAAGQPVEHAAAMFNLGLVQREMDQHAPAADSFRQALTSFGEEEGRARAAAGRELGVTLLEAGELEAAASALEKAAALAEEAGDLVGVGAAANALGIAFLALGRPQPAMDAFRRSAAANPRSIRPAEYAMAKANLALAYLHGNDTARARLAAGQALAIRQASETVRAQAAEVFARTGAAAAAVLTVIRQEPIAGWPACLREEFLRWIDLEPVALRQELAAWIAGQVVDAQEADLAEAWVGALLELPPDGMHRIVQRLLEVLPEQPPDSQRAFHQQLETAMARFHSPQWERLRALFNEVAAELGQERAW